MRSMTGASCCALSGGDGVLFEQDPSDLGIRFPSIMRSHRFYIECVQPVS